VSQRQSGTRSITDENTMSIIRQVIDAISNDSKHMLISSSTLIVTVNLRDVLQPGYK
jgi:hypothetical protein